jgi:hypothetical protein
MDAREFLGRVVPRTGPYLSVAWEGRHGGLPVRSFSINDTGLDEAAGYARWIGARANAYFAISSFNVADTVARNNAQPHLEAPRQLTNVHAIKTLVLDYDVVNPASPKKTGKEFPDLATANKWLADFIRATGLPPPNLGTKSGPAGFHLYWLFDQDIPLSRWQPLARAFQAALIANNFPGDTGPSIDGVRVLRPPETFNRKYDTPVPVKVMNKLLAADYPLSQIEAALQPWIGTVKATGTGPSATIHTLGPRPDDLDPGPALNAAAHANLPQREYYLEVIAKKCAQIKESFDTGGATEGYDHWTSNHLLAIYCVDNEYIHKLSDQYPGYNQANNEAKIKQTIKERDTKNLGPTRCDKLETYRPAICQACPFYQQLATPLVLGDADDDLPPGYRRADAGGHRVIQYRNSEGNWLVLVHGDFRSPRCERMPNGNEALTVTYVLGKYEDVITVEGTELAAPTLQLQLAKQGMSVTTRVAGKVGDFIMAWITKLRNENNVRNHRAKPYGWNYDNHGKLVGIAVAGDHYLIDGKLERLTGFDRTIASNYTPHGTLANWRKAAALFEGGRADLQAIIACSFAAPLLTLTSDLLGFTFNFWSQWSGVGKTSAAKVGQAVWGSWKMMSANNDTYNAALHLLSEPKILPRYWDEFHFDRQSEDKFIDMVKMIPSGRERARLNTEINARTMRDWRTLMIICSNRELMDVIHANDKQTNAGVLRLFEVQLAKENQALDTKAAPILDLVHENYGHAGREYARWLVANAPTAQRTLDQVYARLNGKLNPQAEERFYIAAIATIVAGAVFAKQVGLFNFDVQGIYDCLTDAFMEARGLRGQRTPMTAQGKYDAPAIIDHLYRDWANERLRTEEFKKVGAGTVRVLARPQTQRVFVHVSEKNAIMRVSYEDLLDWLHKQKISSSMLIDELIANHGAIKDRKTIGGGTEFSTGDATVVIDIPLTGAFAGYL